MRLDIVRELAKWLNKEVTVYGDHGTIPLETKRKFSNGTTTVFFHRWPQDDTTAILISVNNFWITLKKQDGKKQSEPLSKLTLSWDDKRDRLKVIVSY